MKPIFWDFTPKQTKIKCIYQTKVLGLYCEAFQSSSKTEFYFKLYPQGGEAPGVNTNLCGNTAQAHGQC